MARRRHHHREHHHSGRAGWLRAGVLGSNDAIVSTASLMIGVGASAASTHAMFVAGVAALFAGSMSMAVGEYVSVSSQRDAEHADIAKEKQELVNEPEDELRELAGIYVKRGLGKELAMQVAMELSAHDQLGAHLRDELGIDPRSHPRPLQAAWVSAASFALFAILPLLGLLAPAAFRLHAIAGITIVSLAVLGAVGGWLGDAPRLRASLRVTIGGAFAMAVTAAIGRLVGTAV
jgi:VIT1/CCC1 family predicted Fe2+/Mn2+ transporter